MEVAQRNEQAEIMGSYPIDKLPAESRNSIYHLVFDGNEPIHLGRGTFYTHGDGLTSVVKRAVATPSILRVNRHLRNDACKLYYCTNTFYLHLGNSEENGDNKVIIIASLLEALKKIDPSAWQSLRRVIVSFKGFFGYYDEKHRYWCWMLELSRGAEHLASSVLTYQLEEQVFSHLSAPMHEYDAMGYQSGEWQMVILDSVMQGLEILGRHICNLGMVEEEVVRRKEHRWTANKDPEAAYALGQRALQIFRCEEASLLLSSDWAQFSSVLQNGENLDSMWYKMLKVQIG